MLGFLVRAALVAVGLWVATRMVTGISIDDGATLLLAAALLGIVNAFVRPLTLILTLPMTLATLGLFILVINAAMLGLVAAMLHGFRLDGFGAAFWSALIVSLTGWIGSWFIGPRGRIEVIVRKGPPD
ncbi:MAG TPA: phage holin family protein [Steroidobacteraceae bacterium]|nr:phage holin family protein [Steroidobacteraceae bacterium]